MSAISIRLPDSLHKKVRELAHRDKVSINHMITLAVAEKLSAGDGGISRRQSETGKQEQIHQSA